MFANLCLELYIEPYLRSIHEQIKRLLTDVSTDVSTANAPCIKITTGDECEEIKFVKIGSSIFR